MKNPVTKAPRHRPRDLPADSRPCVPHTFFSLAATSVTFLCTLGGCASAPPSPSPTSSNDSSSQQSTKGKAERKSQAQVITASTPRPQSKKLRVALIKTSVQDPLLPAVRNGAAQAARSMGAVSVADMASVKGALAQRVDGILLLSSPSGVGSPQIASSQLQATVGTATKAGIPVLTLGSGPAPSPTATHCGASEEALGEEAAHETIALLQKKGRLAKRHLAILASRRGDPTQEARLLGVRQTLKGNTRMNLTGVFYCEGNPQRALAIMGRAPKGQGAIGFTPDAWIVLGNWPLLAGDAWSAAVPTDTHVVAMDPLPATWRSIQSGRVQMCLGHKPFTWGEEGLKLLVKAIDKQKLPPRVNVGFDRVTPQTVASYQAFWSKRNSPSRPAARSISTVPASAASGSARKRT